MRAALALSPDEIESRWPRCRASVITDFGYQVIAGRVVGKTTEAAQRYDVRSSDGTLHRDIPAARIVLLPASETL